MSLVGERAATRKSNVTSPSYSWNGGLKTVLPNHQAREELEGTESNARVSAFDVVTVLMMVFHEALFLPPGK